VAAGAAAGAAGAALEDEVSAAIWARARKAEATTSAKASAQTMEEEEGRVVIIDRVGDLLRF
jgi:hypothetical protein